eukprot:CAMPEP_0201544790 /NCGR_PEP_ID=MMETSP0173_2-20130828/1412_1 /ASSEMBLY_ACC=CAM_ASM_000268 /TAXON_ID=218659 /ORGANISM="Vexillifera sp., Strain DIVA3 564/2" /LENGTH=331 /DNA_ID=CAMNT_0047953045 /DNA_START=77 /DNA_END=1069 /DNA_ORIENTATION=-
MVFHKPTNQQNKLSSAFSTPKAHRPSSTLYVTGLSNSGNTCFFNAVIQGLIAVKPLATVFLQPGQDNEPKIIKEFKSLIKELYGGLYRCLSRVRLGTTLSQMAPRFADKRQHDSHEFLTFLLDSFNEAMIEKKEDLIDATDDGHSDASSSSSSSTSAPVSTSPSSSSSSSTSSTSAPVSTSTSSTSAPVRKRPNQHLTNADDEKVLALLDALIAFDRQSIIHQLCYGYQQSQVHCTQCSDHFSRIESFNCLSLPIVTSDRDLCKVDECFKKYTSIETLEDFYCPTCCKEQLNACDKQLSLLQLPPVLIIQLTRFRFNDFVQEKIETSVDFP